jgi:hypothetical protein
VYNRLKQNLSLEACAAAVHRFFGVGEAKPDEKNRGEQLGKQVHDDKALDDSHLEALRWIR